MTSDSTDTSVVVIGGGQAGLSVSYYLKRLGLDPGNEFVVLDRGPGSGGAWQHRWDALRIGSAHRINDLPGMDAVGLSFETADRTQPAKDVVADYYEQYERFYEFQVVRPAAVSRVVNAGDRMLVSFSDGHGEQTVSTDVVINATGTWGSPFIPWYPGRDSFLGRHVHTAEYADAADFAGKSVVVVGGGTSAIGFLLELEPVAAQTTWVSRRPIEFLEDGELNLEARASAVALQDEAARAGKALPSIVAGTGVPRTRRIQAGIDRGVLTARPMFSAIEPNGVRWSNGSFQEADVIIWSTGFRPELRHLAPLKLREKEGGIMVANGTSWKEPRIFFAGYGPQASTIGANRAGRTVARQAIATLSRLKRQEREADDARLAAEAARNGDPAPFVFLPPEPSVVAELIAPTVSLEPTSASAVESSAAGESSSLVEPVETPVETAVDTSTHARHSDETQEDFDLSWMMPSSEPVVPLDFLPDAPAEPAEPAEPAVFTGFPHPTAPSEPIYVEFEPEPAGSIEEPPADAELPVAEFVEAPDAEPAPVAEEAPVAGEAPVAEPVEARAPIRPLATFASAAIALASGEPAGSADELEPEEPSPGLDSEPEPEAEPEAEAEAEPDGDADAVAERADEAEPTTEDDADAVDASAEVAGDSGLASTPESEPTPAADPRVALILAPEPVAEPAPSVDPAPTTVFEQIPAAQPAPEAPATPEPELPPSGAWSLQADNLPEPVSASDEPRDYVFRFDVEPQDDDFDDSTKPRAHVRPIARELPDFDELLNPRTDD